VLVLALALLASLGPLASLASPSFAEQGAASQASAPPSESRADFRTPTALWLFASVEEAWAKSDAERLAALVDTATVRIAVKPGAPLAAALTRGAAAFLFQDQLRLVQTREFRVTRLEIDPKRPTTRATAVWTGDWGGQRGKRSVKVSLTARPVDGNWLLTEIRAED
jgi:hypothetical protein